MQVLALIEGVDQPCYRYRLEAFAWSMAEQGLLPGGRPLRKALVPRMAQLLAARRAEVVILQRKLLPRWQLALLRGAAKRLVYDVDDALFQRDSYHAQGPRQPHAPAPLRRHGAGGRPGDRRQRASSPAGGRRTSSRGGSAWFPRASSRPGTPPPRTRRSGAAVRLVWIGQRSTLASLGCARRHLAAAAACLPGLQLRVISDSAPALAGRRRSCRGAGRRPPRRPNWPRAISASTGCPTTPGAAASAVCGCCNTWRPVCRWSPIPWA